MIYRWGWRARLPDRYGTFCRVLVRGTRNAVLLEFIDDGFRVITSRRGLRKVKP
jgi:hypothetical protein